MEEYVDVLDENGKNTGEVTTRKIAHQKGLCHKISIVALIDENGKLLMQQRSINKDTEPGKWDLSAAGHVDAGQTSEETAVRETYEELGIKINTNELKKVSSFKYIIKINENLLVNHFSDLYIVKRPNIDIKNIKMQESEVQQIKMCGLQEFQTMLDNNDTVVATNYCKEIMKYMK
ncbi:MAG: NUDIX domain-containing protein [Clostridia bacterium]|nr:NUDIX domain-containing protein [Clostridia bacterium]